MSRRKITATEHRVIAKQLKSMRDEALTLAMGLSANLTRPKINKVIKIYKQIDAARAMLDNEFYSDHPDNFHGKIYYPGSSSDES